MIKYENKNEEREALESLDTNQSLVAYLLKYKVPLNKLDLTRDKSPMREVDF